MHPIFYNIDGNGFETTITFLGEEYPLLLADLNEAEAHEAKEIVSKINAWLTEEKVMFVKQHAISELIKNGHAEESESADLLENLQIYYFTATSNPFYGICFVDTSIDLPGYEDMIVLTFDEAFLVIDFDYIQQ